GALRELKSDYKLSGEISIDLIARYPDIITSEENAIDHEQMWNKLLPALSSALDEINKSRKREGETIKNEFIKGLKNISLSLDKVRAYAPKVVEEYQARLKEKMIEYTSMIDLDESLVLQE